MSTSPADSSLTPREFCHLQQQLIGRLAMRRKRRVAMEPVQEVKARLLTWLEERDPPAEGFRAAIQKAVVVVSPGDATGPAQAVASEPGHGLGDGLHQPRLRSLAALDRRSSG